MMYSLRKSKKETAGYPSRGCQHMARSWHSRRSTAPKNFRKYMSFLVIIIASTNSNYQQLYVYSIIITTEPANSK